MLIEGSPLHALKHKKEGGNAYNMSTWREVGATD